MLSFLIFQIKWWIELKTTMEEVKIKDEKVFMEGNILPSSVEDTLAVFVEETNVKKEEILGKTLIFSTEILNLDF